MAYDPALSTPTDQVRLLLGDTGATPIFPDSTIGAMLALNSNPYIVAGQLARAMAATFASGVDTTVDGLSVSRSQKFKQWHDLAMSLLSQGAAGSLVGGSMGLPIVTGVSIAGMDAVDADTDRPPSAFRSPIMNDPQAGDGFAQ